MESRKHSKFVLCVRSNASEDLEQRKVYQLLPDRAAAREGYIRVIDESGEDYLYPSEYFVPLKLPTAAAQELLSSSRRSGLRSLSRKTLRPTRR